MSAYMSSRFSAIRPSLVEPIGSVIKLSQCCRCLTTKRGIQENAVEEKEEFRVYEIEGLKSRQQTRDWARMRKKMHPPRYRSMPSDQDWTEVWPTASTFNWSVVPLPVRQGYIKSSIENEGVIPGKYANMELMKIPNFLHLTPAHIQKHCEALKELCTPWPEGLDTDEKCRSHFPIEHVSSDYVAARVSQRDPRARVASIKFHLSDLDLDYHARDKFIRLVEHRYNPDTDEVVLESDRCPLKSQNFDFLNFVLTAVYFESWKTEPWESQKQLSDMEKYFWDINKSKTSLMSLFKAIKVIDSSSSEGTRLDYLPQDVSDDDNVCNLPQVQDYKETVESLFNEGETLDSLDSYKNAVKQVLNLKSNV